VVQRTLANGLISEGDVASSDINPTKEYEIASPYDQV